MSELGARIMAAGLVDEGMQVEAIEDELAKAKAVISSGQPVCPICMRPMQRFNYEGYYDSFSYSMVQAKIDPTSMHGYDSPFTPRYPLTPYCVSTTTIKCTPDPKANPPKGIYFSESTGDLIFTPKKCDEFTLFVIGVTEWRKDTSNAWVKIAYTQRDIEFLIADNCGYNNSPSIDGNEISKIRCTGK